MSPRLREPARSRALSVALVGPDGAGKTSITRRVAELLPLPNRVIYMGVNLESSSLMLPTTRLLLMGKRVRGRQPDLTVMAADDGMAALRSLPARIARSIKSG